MMKMKLSTRSKPYIIPEYSLTGDLLSFLTCNLQYRYQNKGTLPPSMPVQLWFGEFIHGVLEEAFLRWDLNKTSFPWDWKEDIRPIENMIDLKLQVRGLYPPQNHFFTTNIPGREDMEVTEADHKKLASARAEAAINIWGPHLFPLIDSTEELIKGIRDMPNYKENISRSNYYGINGVVDVITLFKKDELKKTEQFSLDYFKENEIKNYLRENKEFNENLQKLDADEYEIIIDYKGMKRPSIKDNTWNHHKWQILTYSWLKHKQEDSKPILCGIIFYLNELVPSYEDLRAIKQDILKNENDVKISDEDLEVLMNWDENDEENYPELSDKFKKDRSIRIITVDDDELDNALEEFDKVVGDIEESLIKETNGCKIKEAWKAEADERTCNACDFKTFCNNNKIKEFKVP